MTAEGVLPVTSELGGSGEDDRGLAPNPAPDDGFFGRQDGGYGFGDGGSGPPRSGSPVPPDQAELMVPAAMRR